MSVIIFLLVVTPPCHVLDIVMDLLKATSVVPLKKGGGVGVKKSFATRNMCRLRKKKSLFVTNRRGRNMYDR